MQFIKTLKKVSNNDVKLYPSIPRKELRQENIIHMPFLFAFLSWSISFFLLNGYTRATN